jgi:hypothetical protein
MPDLEHQRGCARRWSEPRISAGTCAAAQHVSHAPKPRRPSADREGMPRLYGRRALCTSPACLASNIQGRRLRAFACLGRTTVK